MQRLALEDIVSSSRGQNKYLLYVIIKIIFLFLSRGF